MTELVSRVKSGSKRGAVGRSAREARLLDAAAALFARFGFDKTSMGDIAQAAGVSKGAVYLHWPSKDALFEATLVREGLRLLLDLRDRVAADPAGGTLASLYRHSLQAMSSNPLLLAVYTLDPRVLGDYVRRQDPAIYARRLLFGEEFVRRMQAAHLMRADLDPPTTAYVMGVISFGLLSMRQLLPGVAAPAPEQLATALADLVHRGLATDDTRATEAGKRAFCELVEETVELYRSSGAPQP